MPIDSLFAVKKKNNIKNSALLIWGIIVFFSCEREDDIILLNEVCDFKTEILSPEGVEVNNIGEIDFNGSVITFQFVNEQIGFAMLSKNAGGFVEVFKTTDGGEKWTNLEIKINQYPIGMIFKDENFGIITVHDVTHCPPPNCQNKCVILKTQNGGIDWEEVEIEELKGILYHPKFDSEGSLYANLNLDDQSSLMKSIDNGENWDTLFSSSELDLSLVAYSYEIFQDKIFISGRNGKILVVSTNGELINTIQTGNSSIWDVAVIDENNLIITVSGKVLKSTNGGETWEMIYDESARMIGFDSSERGLMLLEKSSCPTDVYQANDLIAYTNSGGLNWIEPEETTTNLRINFSNSQRIGNGIWLTMIANKLIEIREK